MFEVGTLTILKACRFVRTLPPPAVRRLREVGTPVACEKTYDARGGVKDRQQPPSDHGQWMSNRLWLRTTNYLGEMLLL